MGMKIIVDYDLYDENDDFGYDIWEQSKSRKTNKKDLTGHTLRNLKKRDFLNHNKVCLLNELVPTLTRKQTEEYYSEGIIVKPNIKDLAPLAVNTYTSDISFSMNKKKRWLLPDILREKALENRLQITTDVNGNTSNQNQSENKESEESKLAIIAVKLHKNKPITTKTKCIAEYFDNFGRDYAANYRINAGSFLNYVDYTGRTRWNRRRNRERTIIIHKKPKKKIVFKNGNRNRNSGIKRRNEYFKRPNTEVVHNVINHDKLLYTFYAPSSILKGTKCWRSNCRNGEKHGILFENYDNKITGTKAKHYNIKRRCDRTAEAYSQLSEFKHKIKHNEDILEEEEIIENVDNDVLPQFKQFLDYAIEFYKNCRDVNTVDIKQRINRYAKLDFKNELFDKSHIVYEDNKTPAEADNNEVEVKALTAQAQIRNILHLINLKMNIVDIDLLSASVKRLIDGDTNSHLCNNYTVKVVGYCLPVKIVIVFDKIFYQMNENAKASLIVDYPINKISDNVVSVNVNCNALDSKFETLESNLNTCLENETAKDFFEIIELVATKLILTFNDPNEFKSSTEPIQNPNKTNDKIYNLLGNISFTDQFKLCEMYKSTLNETIIDFCENTNDLATENDTGVCGSETCDICCDELEWPYQFVTLTKCSHKACIACWQTYIQTKIESLKVTSSSSSSSVNQTNNETVNHVKQITCLHGKCDTVLSLDLLSTIVNIDYVDKYVQFFTDLKILRSNNYVYCPNTKCNKLIIIDNNNNSNNLISICNCGYMVCNKCCKEAHFPAKCSQLKGYLDELKTINALASDENVELYTSEGKHCPNCNNYMEKNGGCNHMSCICGHQYCWVCLKDFYSYHTPSNGYACNNGTKELVRFESNAFMNSNSKLHNYKKELYIIMGKERKIRNDVQIKYRRKQQINSFSELMVKQCVKINQKSKNIKSRNKVKIDDDILSKITPNIPLDTNYMTEARKMITNESFNIHNNLEQLHFINEFLALLLNDKWNRKSENYIFKPNLIRSLRKSMILCELTEKTIENGSSLNDLLKLRNFNKEIVNFINNLKHFTVSSLNLYDT